MSTDPLCEGWPIVCPGEKREQRFGRFTNARRHNLKMQPQELRSQCSFRMRWMRGSGFRIEQLISRLPGAGVKGYAKQGLKTTTEKKVLA
jgi:hypothetical protein